MPAGLAPLLGLLLAGLTLLPSALPAQTIQRCESADRRVTYSDAECPAGTRPVRAVAPAVQPSPEAQREARERLQREIAQSNAERRQPSTSPSGESTVPAADARRAVDCAYLRAELEANRRLRNVLTTRRYYSTEDVEQMDAQHVALAADYRRHCSR